MVKFYLYTLLIRYGSTIFSCVSTLNSSSFSSMIQKITSIFVQFSSRLIAFHIPIYNPLCSGHLSIYQSISEFYLIFISSAISLKKLLSNTRSYNDAYIKPLQVFPSFQKFMLAPLCFYKTLAISSYLFLLTEKNTKRIFAFMKRRRKAKTVQQAIVDVGHTLSSKSGTAFITCQCYVRFYVLFGMIWQVIFWAKTFSI